MYGINKDEFSLKTIVVFIGLSCVDLDRECFFADEDPKMKVYCHFLQELQGDSQGSMKSQALAKKNSQNHVVLSKASFSLFLCMQKGQALCRLQYLLVETKLEVECEEDTAALVSELIDTSCSGRNSQCDLSLSWLISSKLSIVSWQERCNEDDGTHDG